MTNLLQLLFFLTNIGYSYTNIIKAGGNNTCILVPYHIFQHELKCWGDDKYNQVTDSKKVVPSEHIIFSVGQAHSCAILNQSELLCWGSNESGQSDLPSLKSRKPVQVGAGGHHSCMLDDQGKVGCWGLNSSKQSDREWANKQIGQIKEIQIGFAHNCQLLELSNLTNIQCFGSNKFGQLNFMKSEQLNVKVGFSHSCAVDIQNSIKCVGSNNYFELDVPRIVGTSLGSIMISKLSLGMNQTCIVSEIDVLQCWGNSRKGQFGNKNVRDAKDVATGNNHTCYIDTKHIYCNGDDSMGQLDISLLFDNRSFAEVMSDPTETKKRKIDKEFLKGK